MIRIKDQGFTEWQGVNEPELFMTRLATFASLLALTGCGSLPPADQVTMSAEGEAMTALQESQAEMRGAAYAQTQCASCHSVGRAGESPMTTAPRFRVLGQNYPVTDLAEAFAEGVVAGHSAMPQFELSPSENADLIAYLQSIQTEDNR